MDISELKESVDLLEYVSQFADFQRKGDEYWALSPLKEENTPSFSIRQESNTFYDFSSGKGGDILTFIQLYYSCSFSDAVKRLQEYVGVDGEVTSPNRSSAISIAEKCRKLQKSATACKKSEKSAQGSTRVLPEDYLDRFEHGTNKLQFWAKEGISKGTLGKFGVRYDSFTNRLVYPIRDINGRLVNVGGRTLDPEFKEKTIPKYIYLQKWGDGGMGIIYGLYENREAIRERHEVIIFEGAKSVMLADTYGIHNTAAILTSHLNAVQMKQLICLGCRVVFALDKDAQPRLDKNIEILRHFVRVELIRDTEDLLGEKESPIDEGKDVFVTLYNSRRAWL